MEYLDKLIEKLAKTKSENLKKIRRNQKIINEICDHLGANNKNTVIRQLKMIGYNVNDLTKINISKRNG